MDDYYRPDIDVSGNQSVSLTWKASSVGVNEDDIVAHHDFGFEQFSRRKLGSEASEFLAKYTAYVNLPGGDLPDIIKRPVESVMIVSETVKDIVEAFDPDVHEFLEIPKVWSDVDDCAIDEKRYFVFNVTFQKRTIDLDRSNVKNLVRRTDGKNIPFLSALTKEQCVVLKTANQPPHFWRDDFTEDAFVSGELKRAIENAGCQGFNFFECTSASEDLLGE